MNKILEAKENITPYIKEIDFILLKTHWILREYLKNAPENKMLLQDLNTIMSISKKLNELQILQVNPEIK